MFCYRVVLISVVVLSAVPGFCNDLIDTFTSEKIETRTAERGDWSFHDGVASVVSLSLIHI